MLMKKKITNLILGKLSVTTIFSNKQKTGIL